MQIHTEIINPYQTNCYFLTDETSGSTVVIDPGCYSLSECEKIKHLACTKDWHIEQLLATHLHIDHIFGAQFMIETFGCPFGASEKDNYWIDLAPARCRKVGLEVHMPFVKPTCNLSEGDVIHFGKESLSVISVPGHSPGSIAFYNPQLHLLFSGDTLFHEGIGRTDLPRGDYEELISNICEKLLVLPDETVVYPGHYEETTIKVEKEYNSYLSF